MAITIGSGENLVIKLVIDAGQFTAELDKEEAKLKELDAQQLSDKTMTIHVNVDDAEARARLAKDTKPEKKEIKVDIGGGLGLGAILTALPALSPLLATASAGLMGLASAFAAAGAGAAGLAAVAVPALGQVFKANQQLQKAIDAYNNAQNDKQRQAALQKEIQITSQLTAQQQQELDALIEFQNFWQNFTAQFSQPVADLWVNGLQMLESVLTAIQPVIMGAARAFTQLAGEASKALGSPFWRGFFQFLGTNAQPMLVDFGEAIGNLIKGFAGLLMAFQPLSTSMAQGLLTLTQRFAAWATSLQSSQGFHQFIEYVRQNGPLVIQLIGQLASLIGKLLVAMAPFGHVILEAANGLALMLNQLLSLNPIVGQIIVAIMQGAGVLKLLTVGLNLASAAMKLFGVSSTLALGPWGILVAAVVAGALLLITHWQQVSAWASRFWNDVREVWQRLTADLVQAWQTIASTAQSIWDSITDFFQRWGTTLLAIFVPVLGIPLLIAQHWSQIETVAQQIWGDVTSTLTAIWARIRDTASSAWGGMTSAIRNAWSSTTSWLTSAAHAVAQAVVDAFWWMYNHNYYFQDLVDFIRSSWNTIRSTTTEVWNSIRSTLTSVWNSMVSGVRSAWNSISSATSSAWNTIRGALTSAWNAIHSAATSAFNAIRSVVESAWNTVRSVTSSVWNAISGVISSVWGRIRSVINAGASAVRSVLSSAWSAIRSAASSAWNGVISTISGAASHIRSVLSSIASEAFSWGRNFISMLAQGISSGIHTVESAGGAVARAIAKFLGFHSPAEEGPGAEADTWAPNLMKMFAQGIEQYTPMVQAALANAVTPPQVRVTPAVQAMVQGGAQTAVSAGAQTSSQPAQTVHINGPLVHIAQANIRSEQDIEQLAWKIQRLQRQKLRAVGVQV